MEVGRNTVIGTYLEDDVFTEDMLNTTDNVFCFALRKRLRFAAAVEYRSVGSEFVYFYELLGVSGLGFRSSGCDRGSGRWLRRRECVHRLQCTWI